MKKFTLIVLAVIVIGGAVFQFAGILEASPANPGHSAAEISAGAFESGTFSFPDNVGFGTASIDANYRITTAGGGIKAESTDWPAGYFSSASGYGLIVNSGNVGIGTTDPGGPLHVKSGATDIIKTDTSGRVTMPNQPSFYAYATASQSDNTTDETPQKILLAGTRFNVGNHWSTTDSRFTVPVTGIYFFHGEVRLNSLGAGHYTWAKIFVNGNAHVHGDLENSADAVNYRQAAVTAIIQLNAGDYVEFWETTYNTTTTIILGENQTYFMGYLIH